MENIQCLPGEFPGGSVVTVKPWSLNFVDSGSMGLERKQNKGESENQPDDDVARSMS